VKAANKPIIIEDTPEKTVFRLNFELISTCPECLIEVLKRDEPEVKLDITVNLKVPDSNAFEVNQFLTMLNHSQIYGNWEITENNSQILFSMLFLKKSHSTLFDDTLYQNLQKGLNHVDYFSPEIISIALGKNSVIDFIE
jgi:hypothetical protein